MDFSVFNTEENKNLPKKEEFMKNDVVFWICGDSFRTINNDEKKLLDAFINADSKKSLYIEGDNVLYDAAFVDSGFFFKRNFDVEFVRKMPIWALPK